MFTGLGRKMFRVACIIVFIAMPPSVSIKQGLAQETASRINKMVTTLRIVRVESSKQKSDLELVPEQVEQIEVLNSDYNLILEQYQRFIEDENQASALELMTTKLPTLEYRLQSNILLPHQNSLLQKMVAGSLIEKYGDIIEAISNNVWPELKLSDLQVAKLNQLNDARKKAIAEAKRKFDQEVDRINKKAAQDADVVFTKKQREIVNRLRPAPGK